MDTLRTNLRRSVSAAAVAVGLSFATGVGAMIMVTAPAVAQSTLSAEQVAAIQISLRTALAAALTEDAKQDAIAQAVQTAVNTYGVGATAAITSTVLVAAEGAHVDNFVIGRGLAKASGALVTANNTAAADAIASTVGSEANQGERDGYMQFANSHGYSYLASIVGSSAVVTGGTGGIGLGGIGGGATGGGATGGGATGGGGGCLNPSCTSL